MTEPFKFDPNESPLDSIACIMEERPNIERAEAVAVYLQRAWLYEQSETAKILKDAGDREQTIGALDPYVGPQGPQVESPDESLQRRAILRDTICSLERELVSSLREEHGAVPQGAIEPGNHCGPQGPQGARRLDPLEEIRIASGPPAHLPACPPPEFSDGNLIPASELIYWLDAYSALHLHLIKTQMMYSIPIVTEDRWAHVDHHSRARRVQLAPKSIVPPSTGPIPAGILSDDPSGGVFG